MRTVWSRVVGLWTKRRGDADLRDEIALHLQQLTDDHVRRGLSPVDARAAARRDFGGVDQTKERYRDQRGLPIVDWLLQSVRYAARSLRASPGFTIATILLLGVGIGVNTAIFSLVNAVLLRELPYQRPDQLVWVWSVRPENQGPFNAADFIDYRDRNRTLESIGAYADVNTIFTGAGDPARVRGVRVTGNMFRLLGASALVGRTLEPGDDEPDAPPVVVVTQAMWRNLLGSDPDVIGRKLVLNGSPYAVVGVLPSTFLFPRSTPDYATPLAVDRDPTRTRGSINLLRVVGRLKPGVNIGQAEADLSALARQLRAEYPDSNALKIGIHLVPLREAVLGAARDPLEIVVAAVSLLLLVVVVNVASSLLARSTARRKELAVRAALGASRVQLLAQPVAENVLLAIAGGALGVAIAKWTFPVLQAWNPTTFPRAELAVVDGTAMWYAAALSALVVLLIAFAPVWQRPGDVAQALRSRERASHLSRRARSLLIVCEVALSFALLLGASVASQTLVRLFRVEPGFESRQLLTVAVTLPRERYNDGTSVQAFVDRVGGRLQTDRRVRAHSLVSVFPLSGAIAQAPFEVMGSGVSPDRRPLTNHRFVAPNYFQAMGIPVRAGRDFSEQDTAATRAVGVVSEQFARRFLAGRDPIGSHLRVKDAVEARDVEIVGVVGNVKQLDLDEPPAADLYVPLTQVPNEANGYLTRGLTFVIRGDGSSPGQLAASVKNDLLAAEAGAVATMRPAADVMFASLAPRRFLTTLIGTFASFCVLLAGFGLYTVMSYITAQRLHEIAVRMAMGATSYRIARSVIGHAVTLAMLGMAAGTVLAIAAHRLLGTQFEVAGMNAIPFASAAALLLTIVAVAAWLPAWRASRVDPAVSLRLE